MSAAVHFAAPAPAAFARFLLGKRKILGSNGFVIPVTRLFDRKKLSPFAGIVHMFNNLGGDFVVFLFAVLFV